jgi:DNA modification methylase
VQFRFVATATPSPNDYIELLSYAAFLDVMDVSAAKTRFFKRDSEKADNLTLMSHMEEEFWLWVASWALFVTKPSDLGPEFQDEGYVMPPLDIRWHELPTDHLKHAGTEKSGQMRIFADASANLTGVAKEKRDSLPARIGKLMELRAEGPDDHRIVWHDLEAERSALERAIPSMATVFGSQDLDAREAIIGDFADGRIAELGAKPVMLGSGTNLQRHCNWAIFLGIGFKFNDFIQAVHRLRRFGQPHTVRLDLIYTEAERGIRRALERKWKQHNDMVEKMTGIVREYGLSDKAMHEKLVRAMGVERVEKSGENFKVILNDTIKETAAMPEGSVQLIVTSIPFSTQYEYSPNYADFGHTDNDKHFWQQMDYLVPSMLRALEPGRICAIHVKDRVIPGGISGYGFQTLSTLHMDCVYRFKQHGFAYLGMKTITTDVVRENNQTYRLGWTEQCKDGSRMGVGVPEYLLIFRKPPTDASNGYADSPPKKAKKEWDPEAKNWRNEGGYSRARWQLDAHGYAKSSGDRVLAPEELNGLDASQVYKLWRQYGQNNVYDYEHHVMIGEALEVQGRLPPTFMLLQPHTLHPDVWTDVARMMTLNSTQAAKGKEQHLCPLQFDIVDRCIVQYTEPGEWVYDPFGGIGTVPYRAVKLGRKGMSCELSRLYWIDACIHVETAARGAATPSLFDVMEAEEALEAAE